MAVTFRVPRSRRIQNPSIHRRREHDSTVATITAEMPPDNSPPSALTITAEAFEHVLSLYPDVLKSLYQTKVRTDDKKREQALTDDVWRYETFPDELQDPETDAGFSFSLKELERLVRWKMYEYNVVT